MRLGKGHSNRTPTFQLPKSAPPDLGGAVAEAVVQARHAVLGDGLEGGQPLVLGEPLLQAAVGDVQFRLHVVGPDAERHLDGLRQRGVEVRLGGSVGQGELDGHLVHVDDAHGEQ